MKLKNKILILIIFSMLIFFITGLDVFATDLNTYLSPNADTIINNLPIPSEISGDNFVRIIVSEESSDNEYQNIKLCYFDKTTYNNFSKICLFEESATKYTLRPYDENNENIYSSSNCADFYGYYIYTTQDFLNYELSSQGLPGVSSFNSRPIISSDYSFVTSNVDIYDIDMSTMVFQRPVEQSMVGLIPLETLRPTQVQEKIAETLKTIVPIALMVFSALLSPFLIRYLISLKR